MPKNKRLAGFLGLILLSQKNLISLHKHAKQRFHMNIAVFLLLDSEIQCWVGPGWGSASSPRVGVINTLLPTSEEMGYGEGF